MSAASDVLPRDASGKPLPMITPEGAPFWEATLRGELVTQRCDSCEKRQFPPRLLCRFCGGRELQWQPTAPRGTIYSFTIIHRPPEAAFAADVPYVLAVVQLEEGGRIMANLVDCTPDRAHVEMAVEAVFEQVSDEIALVRFRPVRG